MKKALLFLVGVMVLLAVPAYAATYANPLIQTDKDIYIEGEQVRVYYYNAPGYARDWICVVPEGAPDTYAGNYQYIPQGSTQGVMVFTAPQPGDYEVRAYYGYNPFQYFVSARYPFTVEGEEGYVDGGYYEPPITYGEPCYYTPPVTVTFSFDFFTYELYGPYVDIVFWKDGHRYRHHRWYDQGRRVTPDHIHSGQWHHKIPFDELKRHRDKLRDNNKIIHSDSFYGIKARSEGKPDVRRSGQDNKRPDSQSGKGFQPKVTGPQTDIKKMPQKVQPGQTQQGENKSGQQTPKKQVGGQQSSGQQDAGKPSSQTTKKSVWGQSSQPSEQKSGSGREKKSVEKSKKSRESSGSSEYKDDSNNRSQSGGGTSRQSDNRGWSGSSGGNSGGSFGGGSGGRSQGSPGGKNDDKKGR